MSINGAVKALLNKFGVGFMRHSVELGFYEMRTNFQNQSSGVEFLKKLTAKDAHLALDFVGKSKGQIHQDIFVLVLLDYKKEGYFVEFGAVDGVDGSNSLVLEKEFQWRGVCAEPAKKWHEKLAANRSCYVSRRCVWSESNKSLVFNEVDDGGFSTIDAYSGADHHVQRRQKGAKYQVQTISLNDLLVASAAPKKIDYLSIDTEGSEFDILSAFDFNEWEIAIITVEHNYTANREKIFELLEGKGFVRVLTALSQFDDWYVCPALVGKVAAKFPSYSDA